MLRFTVEHKYCQCQKVIEGLNIYNALKGNDLDCNKFNYTDTLFEYKILLKEESILRYIVRIIIGE